MLKVAASCCSRKDGGLYVQGCVPHKYGPNIPQIIIIQEGRSKIAETEMNVENVS